MTASVELNIVQAVSAGERCVAAIAESERLPVAVVGELGTPAVGSVLRIAGEDLFQVVSHGWDPQGGSQPSRRIVMLDALCDVEPAANAVCEVVTEGLALAWITMSDKGSQGKRHDESGPLIAELVGEKLSLRYSQGFVLPDDERQLRHLLMDLALGQGFDLIMTTGGTGVAPRDVTPEATLAVIEKRLPGYERAMTAASLVKTPHGAVSRAVAGTLGPALIVNMPGSPKAVRECLEPLLPTLEHTVEKLHGDPSDCAILRT